MRPRTRRGGLAAVVVIAMSLSLVAPAAGAAKTRNVEERYTTTATGGLDCSTNSNGACFELAGDEARVGLTVSDGDGWRDLPFRFEFRDGDDRTLSTGDACDRVEAAVPTGATVLRVEVGMVTLTGCSHPTHSRGGTVKATFDLKPSGKADLFDEERRCTGGLGEPLSYALSPDDGRTVTVDALVLLDGIAEAGARELMEDVISGFAQVDITLRADYRTVDLTAEPEVDALFDDIKAQVGGEVPEGYELVHTFTTKDIVGWAGYADCVGGIQSRVHAFSISEARGTTINIIRGVPSPVWFWGDAYLAAHEIGHLFGGGHDLANCVEGVELREGAVPAPCTLMHPNLNVSYRFSTVNRAVVRGHAVDFAAP